MGGSERTEGGEPTRQAEISARLRQVRAEIHRAATGCGRDAASIRLIAVSKTRPIEDIRAAMRAGHLDFGENYAQELRDKADLMQADLIQADPERTTEQTIRWHFIGSLQRNKVKYVAGRAELVHDIDSLALAGEFGKRALLQRPGSGHIDILAGVNIGREPQKSGWMPDQIPAILPQLAAIPGIRLCGLMCIPPAVDDPEQTAPLFEEMAAIAAAGAAAGFPLPELSMGMSHDYAVAIRCGATMVRVGTAIFGSRSTPA